MAERRPILSAPAADKPTVTTNGSGPPTFAAVQAEIEAAMAAGELSLPQKFTLFERKLKAALSDSGVTSSELEKIARETDVAIEVARQEAVAARGRGLDLCADARLARAEIDDVEFFVSRLLTQRPRLEALLQARRQADQRAAYVVRYEQLKIEGAVLAQQLVDLYPTMVGPLVELFGRLRDFQQKSRALHLTDPGDGRPHIIDPELAARGLRGFSGDNPSLLESVHLHDWQSGKEIWPPRPPSFAAEFVQSMGIPQHPGAAWSDPEFQARRAAERAAENERLARIAEERAAAQLERENRELREQWDSRQQNGGHETR